MVETKNKISRRGNLTTIVAILALAIAVLGLFAVDSSDESDAISGVHLDGLTYDIQNGEATVTSYYYSPYDLIIPQTIEYNGSNYPVVAIGENAFKEIRSYFAIIPDSVKVIKMNAFKDGWFYKISIGSGVTSIEDFAFEGCENLEEFEVSPSNRIFSSSNGVLINESADSLMYYPILKKGKTYEVPSGIRQIDGTAFQYNKYLESVTIPASVNRLTPMIFAESSIQSVEFKGRIETIPYRMFYNCDELRTVTIKSDFVLTVESEAFKGCTSLTKIGNGYSDYPDSYFDLGTVNTIRDGAFESCSSVREIKVGGWDIGNYAFRNCTSLESVIIIQNNRIGASAFADCSSLTDIDLGHPNLIDDQAFSGCVSLKTLDLGRQLGTLRNYIFEDCSSITTVIIPDTIDSLTSMSFERCDSLKTIEISENGGKSVELFADLGDYTMIPAPSGRNLAFCSDTDHLDTIDDIGSYRGTAYFVWYDDGADVKVRFEPGQGFRYTEITITAGEAAPQSPEFNLDRIEIEGWYIDKSLTKRFDFSSLLYEDITLYAKWVEKDLGFTVTYLRDGERVYGIERHQPGETVVVAPVAEKQGHSVSDWTTDDVAVNSGKFIMPSHDVVFRSTSSVNQYPVWIGDDCLVLSANGKIIKNGEMLDYGTRVDIELLDRPGYIGTIHIGGASSYGTWFFVPAGESSVSVDWTPENEQPTLYNITFDSNGGSYVQSQTVQKGNLLKRPMDPTRSGYSFEGWYWDKECTNEFIFDFKINGSYTLYAKWTPNAGTVYHTVTFDSKGGSYVEPQRVADGERAEFPLIPTKDGYEFLSWCLDEMGTMRYLFNTPVTEDITLYAIWTEADPEVGTVRYLVNHTTVFTESHLIGERVTVREKYVMEGYTVGEWYSDDADISSGTFVMGERYVDIHADATRNKYTITFVTGDGATQFEPRVQEYGTKVYLQPDPYRDGYIFVGWDPELPETMPAHDITVTAVWESDGTVEHTVTYVTNGGTPIQSREVEHGKKAVQYHTSRDGYKLDGWYTDSGLTERYDFTLPVISDLTLYAKWEHIGDIDNAHTVTFVTNSETSEKSQTVGDGAIAEEPNCYRPGYEIAGWYTDPELTIRYSFSTPVTSDLTLYAKWAPVTNRVTFVTSGGSPVEPIDVADSAMFTEPVTVREGYRFDGWFKDSDLKTRYAFTSGVYDDITLYAKWTQISNETHLVSYYSFPYQDSPQYSNVQDRNTFGFDITYDKEEYRGWFMDMECTIPYNVSTPVTSDLTLYAGWDSYGWHTVTYVVDGKVVMTQTVGSDAYPFVSARYSSDGIIASEWSSADVAVEGNRYHMPDRDVMFTATMSETTHTVSFDTGGGTALGSISIGNDKRITPPADPVRPGCVFTGWYADKNCTKAYDFTLPLDSNTKLYAGWVPEGQEVPEGPQEGSNTDASAGGNGAMIGVIAAIAVIVIAAAVIVSRRR